MTAAAAHDHGRGGTADPATGAGATTSPHAENTGGGGAEIERIGAHIEDLLERLGTSDPRSARLGEELVRTLVGLYGAGLERILAVLDDAAPDTPPRLAADPLVAGLLSLHDLHPVGLLERIEAALDDVRPYLGSHGGDVSVLGVDGDTLHLRLEGTCNGCGSSEATLTHAVEGAVHRAAPEIATIEVEGAVPAPQHNGGLIPLESLLVCPTEVGGVRS